MAEVIIHETSVDRRSVFNNIYIHDSATNVEPALIFKANHDAIRRGQAILVERRLAVLVTERLTGVTKQEFVIEYDIVPFNGDTILDWWERSAHCALCFHHKGRLTGRGVSVWSYVPDVHNRVRVLACHADVLPYCTLD